MLEYTRSCAGLLRYAATIAAILHVPLQVASASDSATQPNIIFIFSDDLSYRDLSCYGQESFSTPNLDRLAMEVLRFRQAYSGSSACAPSRASLMTGMHMGHCRIRSNRSVRGQEYLEAEDVTVAEILRKGGYRAGFIGKWGIGLPGTTGSPHKQGFDLAYGYYDQARAHGFFPHYLVRVPFFASWPGTIRPGESEHVCALYDFASTAAELAGVEAPATDGISLVPILRGEPKRQRSHPYLYWENESKSLHAQSTRFGSWWAFRPHPSQQVQIYDLENDRACANNLAGERPELVERARAIFAEAHSPSKWYVNPGEDEDQAEAKRQRGRSSKGLTRMARG